MSGEEGGEGVAMTLMGGMTEGLECSWRVKIFVSRSFNGKERLVIEAVRSRTMEVGERNSIMVIAT